MKVLFYLSTGTKVSMVDPFVGLRPSVGFSLQSVPNLWGRLPFTEKREGTGLEGLTEGRGGEGA